MIAPTEVMTVLRRHLPPLGIDLVVDLQRSRGCTLVDARDGTEYLDLFGFYASNVLGMNHPRLLAARDRLVGAALHKPSNSDVATVEMATFVDTFERVLGDPRLPHLFLIEGGALAVENALKAAFDYKSRRNEAAGRSPELGTRVLHLTGAFHGRSGYTMSLTNTDPVKTARFPTFDWPRVEAPVLRFPLADHEELNRAAEERALAAIEEAFVRYPHDIACFIAEPIQCEGGDRHLSADFLRAVQELCHRHDALFVLDEVQTGVGGTGTAWCYQQLGLEPDLVAFGKKTHVCGVMAGGRLDELPDNVFRVPGRINSTFGGGLVDMVRATVVLETIEEEDLFAHVQRVGAHLLAGLEELARRYPEVTNVRGRGLLCAFDLPDGARRDEVRRRLFTEERIVILGCGERSIRFRPPLIITPEEVDRGLEALDRVLRR